jgi:hypothetical protein
MRFVPEPDDRRWILEHLAELIHLRGAHSFLRAPLRTPDSTHFPDRWRGDAASVRRQLRRVLDYAGLADVGFHLGVHASGLPPLEESLVHCAHASDAIAWFSGLDDDLTARFGVDERQLSDPATIVGVLCHEAAHCYRARFELTYFDELQDELLTDLTTVYLGFGVLTAKTSQTRETVAGGGVRKAMRGYLSPVAMCFALAAQVVARRGSGSDVKAIGALLGGVQEACFVASCRELERDASGLVARLGAAGVEPTRVRRGVNEGLPVFRVKRGWLRRPICSGPDCGAPLSTDATICERCGGMVQGDVESLDAAAAAEDRLAEDAGRDVLALLSKKNVDPA